MKLGGKLPFPFLENFRRAMACDGVQSREAVSIQYLRHLIAFQMSRDAIGTAHPDQGNKVA